MPEVGSPVSFCTIDGKHMSYKKGDYDRYHASDKMKRERAARNKARRKAEREGRVRKGDDKEVDHIDGNPMNSARSNQRVITRHANRVKQ